MILQRRHVMLQGQPQCLGTIMRSGSWRSSGVYLETQAHPMRLMVHCTGVVAAYATGQGTVNADSSRTLSHSQVSSGVLQGPLCLGPPPNTWETSEHLLPLSATTLSHLVLLALKSGQLVEPRHISNISQSCKQSILCKSFIFNERLGCIFFQ